jgi:regulator of protease activity HflC (stomatin/prohibitin superfamily)
MLTSVSWGVVIAAFVGLLLLLKWFNVLKEYERGVVFRLGRVLPEPKGPGLVLVFWPIDRLIRVPLRTVVLDIPPQDVITRDNVSIKVNAVVYYRVLDPIKATVQVEQYEYATSQLGQTTLCSVLGEVELDELLAEREKINVRLQSIIDRQSDPWGIKVALVEVKHVDLPQGMQRAMARQAEAEREKRGKVIHAEGEYLAAQRLADAAEVIQERPVALQLRYLQTLTDIASERNSTIVFPLPLDLVSHFFRHAEVSPERDEEPKPPSRPRPPATART